MSSGNTAPGGESAELHRRAHAYAAEVVKAIGSHRYHGVEPGVQVSMLEALCPDIARAFVIGYAAGVESEAVANRLRRVSYPPKVPRSRRRR